MTQKRKRIMRPGSRGGKGYYDEHGNWQYGERPKGTSLGPGYFSVDGSFRSSDSFSLRPELAGQSIDGLDNSFYDDEGYTHFHSKYVQTIRRPAWGEHEPELTTDEDERDLIPGEKPISELTDDQFDRWCYGAAAVSLQPLLKQHGVQMDAHRLAAIGMQAGQYMRHKPSTEVSEAWRKQHPELYPTDCADAYVWMQAGFGITLATLLANDHYKEIHASLDHDQYAAMGSDPRISVGVVLLQVMRDRFEQLRGLDSEDASITNDELSDLRNQQDAIGHFIAPQFQQGALDYLQRNSTMGAQWPALQLQKAALEVNFANTERLDAIGIMSDNATKLIGGYSLGSDDLHLPDADFIRDTFRAVHTTGTLASAADAIMAGVEQGYVMHAQEVGTTPIKLLNALQDAQKHIGEIGDQLTSIVTPNSQRSRWSPLTQLREIVSRCDWASYMQSGIQYATPWSQYVLRGLTGPEGHASHLGFDAGNVISRRMQEIRKALDMAMEDVASTIRPEDIDIEGGEIKNSTGDMLHDLVIMCQDKVGIRQGGRRKVRCCTKEEIDQLQKQINQSTNKKHGFKLRVLGALDISYDDGDFDFQARTTGNVRTLYHGSKPQHAYSILRCGLHPPSPATGVTVDTGSMFGRGIYFADQSTKSANYSFGEWMSHAGEFGTLWECEVVLGEMKGGIYAEDKKLDSDLWAEYNATGWDHDYHHQGMEYDSIEASAGTQGLKNNEYVVFNADQVRLRRLMFIEEASDDDD